MVKALVMAGGRSQRMRTGGAAHKALVPALGMTLLERNVRMLLAHGFRDIAVSVNEEEPQVRSYLDDAIRPLLVRHKASLATIVETARLGTIGSARLAAGDADVVLVVNVDNLTALDLRALVEHHLASGAALTIASHTEPWTMPFGELRISGGRVDAYLEKPEIHRTISSGTYVLSAKACRAIPAGEPVGIPQLFETLREVDEPIVAFEHDAPWIDVNDREALQRAEALIARYRDRFEPWNAAAVR